MTIYLDYNATSPLLPAVAAKMEELALLPLNPSSVHKYGRQARKLVEDARKTLAEYLSVWPNEIIFTASGTEANNLALKGIPDSCLLVAASEHSSVLNVARLRECSKYIPVDSNGLVKLDALVNELQLCNARPLVSVMLVNNETGVIQPIREIAEIVHKHGGLLHCDAVQALGKMRFDFGSLGCDMLTVAAHKVGGPLGVGALVVRNDLVIQPQIIGGGQELRRRAGTENVPAIAGFGWTMEQLPDLSFLAPLKAQMEQEILAKGCGARVMGAETERVLNTSSIIMPGVSSEVQLMNFDLVNICVSAGSACSSGRIEQSHVLIAMGCTDEEAGSAIRISMGWGTTAEDVSRFTQEWVAMCQRLKNKKAA
jgi:cysteine desulfurase